MLRIGFGRVDTTPELGLRVAGTAPWPPATSIAGPLRGRVLLADDGAQRVGIVFLDLMALPAAEVATLRSLLASAGGLDPHAIMVACSHTHTAPFTFAAGAADERDVYRYLDEIYPKLAKAMADAAARFVPATIGAGRTIAPGLTFNRRPIYANGEVATHGPTWVDDFAGLEDRPDEELHLLVARDSDEKTIGGMVDFACHPTVMEGRRFTRRILWARLSTSSRRGTVEFSGFCSARPAMPRISTHLRPTRMPFLARTTD
jgi:neutral ceramidase